MAEKSAQIVAAFSSPAKKYKVDRKEIVLDDMLCNVHVYPFARHSYHYSPAVWNTASKERYTDEFSSIS